METKSIAGYGLGAGVSTAGVYISRKYLDPKYKVDRFGKFGQPTTLIGITAGAPSLLLGIAGEIFGKGPLRGKAFLAPFATSFGATAVTGAMLSLLFPVEKKRASVSLAPVSIKASTPVTAKASTPVTVKASTPTKKVVQVKPTKVETPVKPAAEILM